MIPGLPSKSVRLLQQGEAETARERFGGLVAMHQRRALRIAYQYLREPADADEAVQDAFVRSSAISVRIAKRWPFEVWFTRILINGCLDRRKSTIRRERGIAPVDPTAHIEEARPAFASQVAEKILKRACCPANAANAWLRLSTGSMAASVPSSCCALTATALRGRSAP